MLDQNQQSETKIDSSEIVPNRPSPVDIKLERTGAKSTAKIETKELAKLVEKPESKNFYEIFKGLKESGLLPEKFDRQGVLSILTTVGVGGLLYKISSFVDIEKIENFKNLDTAKLIKSANLSQVEFLTLETLKKVANDSKISADFAADWQGIVKQFKDGKPAAEAAIGIFSGKKINEAKEKVAAKATDAVDWIKEHPYLTAAITLGVVAAVGGLFVLIKNYLSEKTNPAPPNGEKSILSKILDLIESHPKVAATTGILAMTTAASVLGKDKIEEWAKKSVPDLLWF